MIVKKYKDEKQIPYTYPVKPDGGTTKEGTYTIQTIIELKLLFSAGNSSIYYSYGTENYYIYPPDEYIDENDDGHGGSHVSGGRIRWYKLTGSTITAS